MVRLLVFVVIVALLALIVVKLIKSFSATTRAPRDKQADAPSDAKLVRCAACGAFVPRSDALPAPDGFRCTDPKCREAS